MTPEAIGSSPVRKAIANASYATGMDFDFLLATASRESSLNPTAQARTSSATGLFQFLDATWLTTIKRHGAKHGLAGEASQIDIGNDGRPNVADPAMRRMILDMRFDPEVSARMAAEFATDNADYLRTRTGVEPQKGDLYAAHFLGAAGAAELVMAARDTPWMRAAALFPAAAGANRSVFYERNGQARSVGDVLENLRETANRAPAEIEAPNTNWSGVAQIDAFTSGRLLTSAMRSNNFSSQPNDFVRILAEQSLSGAANEVTLNPAMFAEIYRASDQMREASAAQAVSSILGGTLATGSIAQALSPSDGDKDRSSDQSQR